MSGSAASTPLMVDTATGVRAMVRAMEKEVGSALVPRWPWVAAGFALKHLPLRVARKFM
jgi:hypothetical protein